MATCCRSEPGLTVAARRPIWRGMDDAGTIRLASFIGVLAVLVTLERWRPWSQPRPLGMRRWFGNLGLAALSAGCVALLLPAAAIAAAVWAEAQGVGLLHWLDAPAWLAIPVGFLALDFTIYWQHRITHAVPLLWRLHRVHHGDPELDASSALRFHPIEIVGSMVLKIATVAALGAPPAAVLAFEIALNAGAMFSHAAIALPPRFARALGWLVVTPDMHRIHHGERPEETNSCFGFCLPWWDWWFGTWRGAPAGKLVIGVEEWRATPEQRLDRLLSQPFRDHPCATDQPARVTPAAAP